LTGTAIAAWDAQAATAATINVEAKRKRMALPHGVEDDISVCSHNGRMALTQM